MEQVHTTMEQAQTVRVVGLSVCLAKVTVAGIGDGAVMLDTVGAEMQVVNKSEKAISLQQDDNVILTPDNGQEAISQVLPINFDGLAKAVKKGDTIFVGQYLFTGSETTSVWLERIIASLHNEFAMTDIGSLNYFLGISAQRSASGLFLSQSKFIEEIIKRAHMQNCNPCRTPVDTESKLGSDGDLVCLYMHDPRDPHFTALKRILCYVCGTLDYGLQLHVSSTTQLSVYTNVDWAGCPVTRRSTSGYCVFLGDNLLSWSAKCQVTLSHSSAEVEYRGVANVVAQTAWIRNLLCELHTPLFTAALVYCDNVSAVYMFANPVQHQRTKHIKIDIHFVRDFVASEQVHVLHVPSRFYINTFSILNLSFIRFEILIEPSKYFNLKVFTRLSDFCDHKFITKIKVSVIMTNGESVKDMTSKFDKLEKFEGQDEGRDFCRWQKKMHFLLTTLKVMYVLSTPSPVWSENETLKATRKKMKWENDDYICRGHILNGMSDSLFDIYQNVESAKALWDSLESKYIAEDASAKKFLVIIIDKLSPSWKEFKHGLKHKKEELNLVRLGSHLRIEEGLRNQKLDNNPKGKNQIGSSSVNMVEGDGAKNSKNDKNKRKFKSGDDKFANKKATGDEVAWWFDSGATNNVLYVLGIQNNLVSEIVLNKYGYKQVLESDKYILSRHGSFVGFGYVCNGMIRLNLNCPLFNASACMITSSHSNSLSKSELWHARLGHIHYKRMRDMSKMSLIPAFDMTLESCKTCMLTKITRQPFKGVNRESKVLDLIHSDLCNFHANPLLGNNKYVINFIDDASRYSYVYLLHAKHEALDKFKIYKQEVELQRQDLIKVLRTDRGGEYYDQVYFQSTGIIHQTTAPYTPQ
ncbi:zinc finger, CCHC-type containing protein [Tanacetum coccineum]